MGSSPKEPAEAGRMLREDVCCPQEGALRKAPSGRPGARRVGHRVGLPSRVSGVWEVLGEEGGAAGLRAACVSACRASLAFWDVIPQGLQGGEVSPLCHHPGHEKLGFSRWNKGRTPGLEGWHIEEWFVGVSESKQGQEEAESGLGRDGDPPCPPRTGHQAENSVFPPSCGHLCSVHWHDTAPTHTLLDTRVWRRRDSSQTGGFRGTAAEDSNKSQSGPGAGRQPWCRGVARAVGSGVREVEAGPVGSSEMELLRPECLCRRPGPTLEAPVTRGVLGL